MILGSSDLLDKRGNLLPLSLGEPPLGFQEVPGSAGRISWLGFGQDSIACGNWLLLPNARVHFQCLILLALQDEGIQELEMGSQCSRLSAGTAFWICSW